MEHSLKYPSTLQSSNISGYPIVLASEIGGHRSVKNLTYLYSLSDAQLFGDTENSDSYTLSIGQLWYVVSENSFYQLTSQEDRNKAAGWKKVNVNGLSAQTVGKNDETILTSISIDNNGNLTCTSYPLINLVNLDDDVISLNTAYNNLKKGYDLLTTYVTSTYANVKTSYDNLKNGYDNLKKGYDNLNTGYTNLSKYVTSTYTNVKTSYDNLKKGYDNLNTGYTNLSKYVTSTYANVKTSYDNLKKGYDLLMTYVKQAYAYSTNYTTSSYNLGYAYSTYLSYYVTNNTNEIEITNDNLIDLSVGYLKLTQNVENMTDNISTLTTNQSSLSESVKTLATSYILLNKGISIWDFSFDLTSYNITQSLLNITSDSATVTSTGHKTAAKTLYDTLYKAFTNHIPLLDSKTKCVMNINEWYEYSDGIQITLSELVINDKDSLDPGIQTVSITYNKTVQNWSCSGIRVMNLSDSLIKYEEQIYLQCYGSPVSIKAGGELVCIACGYKYNTKTLKYSPLEIGKDIPESGSKLYGSKYMPVKNLGNSSGDGRIVCYSTNYSKYNVNSSNANMWYYWYKTPLMFDRSLNTSNKSTALSYTGKYTFSTITKQQATNGEDHPYCYIKAQPFNMTYLGSYNEEFDSLFTILNTLRSKDFYSVDINMYLGSTIIGPNSYSYNSWGSSLLTIGDSYSSPFDSDNFFKLYLQSYSQGHKLQLVSSNNVMCYWECLELGSLTSCHIHLQLFNLNSTSYAYVWINDSLLKPNNGDSAYRGSISHFSSGTAVPCYMQTATNMFNYNTAYELPFSIQVGATPTDLDDETAE